MRAPGSEAARMQAMTLFLGSKRRSSWSLRPWLLMRHHGLAFTEQVIALDTPQSPAQILLQSLSGRVPVLHHGELRVWESLAICEYAAESFALPEVWPQAAQTRALARSLAAEMHAGFAALRRELPFDACREPERLAVSAAAASDIARICAIWTRPRRRHGVDEAWRFGRFGIVDAMFTPVTLRFHAYEVAMDGVVGNSVETVLAHPACGIGAPQPRWKRRWPETIV